MEKAPPATAEVPDGYHAVVCRNTFAGRIESPCRIVGETATRWRIEVDETTRLPGRILQPGMRALVPKSAVRLMHPGTWFHGTRRAFDHPAPGPSGLLHFTQDAARATEFAACAARTPSPLDAGFRLLEARLAFSRPLDPRTAPATERLLSDIDWQQAVREMQEVTQSQDWAASTLQAWARAGYWQIYELPTVLAWARQRHDAVFLEELGDWGVAVFDPGQVKIVAVHTAPPPAPAHRPRPA